MSERFDDLELLHTRNYSTRSYRDGASIVVVGTVHDLKPPGLYIVDDPEPLGIHQMQVVLRVDLATLAITEADVDFGIHPHETCPSISTRYGELVGLSVTRGFSRNVRELFGGPRGCSHTTALLLAMAPVVTQSLWSVRTLVAREQGVNPFSRDSEDSDGEEPEVALANLNTCHIWAEDGDLVAAVRAGEWRDVPVWITRRYAELGRDPAEWSSPVSSN